MKRARPPQGFTLIELIIVIVILGIIGAMSIPILMQGLNTFPQAESLVNANWQGQLAIERLSRDISLIRSPADVTTMSANNLSFTDTSGNTIAYSLSGNSLTLTQSGTNETLADGIQSLAFSYYDQSGATTGTSTAVRLIGISINITQGNANYVLTTMIYPRNLQ